MRFGAGRVLRRRLCGRDLLGSGDRGACLQVGGDERPWQEGEWSDGKMGERQERWNSSGIIIIWCVSDEILR